MRGQWGIREAGITLSVLSVEYTGHQVVSIHLVLMGNMNSTWIDSH